MKTSMEYFFGPELSTGIILTIVLLALLTFLGYCLIKKWEAKDKQDKEDETAYKHRELNNANLYDRKH